MLYPDGLEALRSAKPSIMFFPYLKAWLVMVSPGTMQMLVAADSVRPSADELVKEAFAASLDSLVYHFLTVSSLTRAESRCNFCSHK